MLGLSLLGAFHTVVGLVAVVAGFTAVARDKEISPRNHVGQIYLVTTLISAATALGIFRHGAFGPPHAVAILTIVALAIGTSAAFSGSFGRASRYVQVAAYSATLLFHMIPAVTESLTRLPPNSPIAASVDAPIFKPIYGALLVLFLIGLAAQIAWLRRATATGDVPAGEHEPA